MSELNRDRHGNRIFGIVIGVVTNLQDPENRGRVRVKYPWLDQTLESDWARVVTFYAGKGRGSYFMPEVDDEVVLMFHGGDPEKPYVVGSLWNGKDNVPGPGNPDGKNDDKWFESRSGHQLKFNDGSSPRITLIDSSKKNSFVVDVNANTITQKAETGDIFWSAPKGSINLECVDLNVSCSGSAAHGSGATESWTVGVNQEITVQTGQSIAVGASSKQTTPNAVVSYTTLSLQAGVAQWTLAALDAKIKQMELEISAATKTIGKETSTVQTFGLLANVITHNGGVILEGGQSEGVGYSAPSISWMGGMASFKGQSVTFEASAVASLLGGLIALNPKAMVFPVAKLLDTVVAPFTDVHNIAPSWFPPFATVPMVPHPSFGPIILQICPSILCNGLPIAGAGADCLGLHIPIYGLTEAPMPPRCIGKPLNTVLQGVIAAIMAAMMAHSIASIVGSDAMTGANKASALIQMLLGILIGFIPFPVMKGGIMFCSPTVASNGQPTGLVLTPLGAMTCTEIPFIPNALPLGFTNVLAGIDFGEMLTQFAMHLFMQGLAYLSRRFAGHPVDVVSGSMYAEDTDIELPGPTSFRLDRFYNSVPAALATTPKSAYAEVPPSTLGVGWRHSYEEWVHDDGEKLRHFTYQGLVKTLPRPVQGDGKGLYASEHAVHVVMDDAGNVYLRDDQGATLCFKPRGPHDPWLRLVSDADENGNTVTVEHGHHGRINRIKDSAGRVLRFLYGDDGLLDAVRLVHTPVRADIDVHLVSYVHDGRGDLREVLDRAHVAKRYEYDDRHLITRETDRNGNSFHFEYDWLGRCVKTYGDDDSFYAQLEFLPGVRITKVIDGYGGVSEFHADDRSRLAKEVLPSGATTRFEYDALGHTTLIAEPDGGAWEFEYDDVGNVTKVTRPDGLETTTEYDDRRRVVSAVDFDGATWRTTYDDAARSETHVGPSGTAWRFGFDARGLQTSVELPSGFVETRRYDWAGNEVERNGAGGRVERKEWDELGQLVAEVDESGNRWSYTHDAAGRLVREDLPGGTSAVYEYDGEGHLTRRREGDRTDDRYVWGAMGRLREHTNALGQVTRFDHGLYRDLKKVRMADGSEVTLEHDADLNVVRIVMPNGTDERYRLDARGRCTSLTDGEREWRFTYDCLDNYTSMRLPDGTMRFLRWTAGARLQAVEVQGPLDDAPREVLNLQYNADGYRTSESAGGVTQRFEYSPLGNRTRLATTNGLDVAFERDAFDTLVGIALPDGSSHRFARDAMDRVTEWRTPHGLVESRQYTGFGALAEVVLGRAGAGPVARRSYRYHADLTLAASADDRRGQARYEKDGAMRIVGVDRDAAPRESYRYDPVGNLIETSRLTMSYVGQKVVRAIEKAAQSAAAETHVYDERGRLVRQRLQGDEWRRYEWDDEDLLVRVVHPDGGTTEYEYDVFGRRTAKFHEGKRTEYGWDVDRVLWERSGSATTFYLYDDPDWTPLVKLEGGTTFTFHVDQAGFPLELRDETGDVAWSVQERTAYGRTTVAVDARTPNAFRYPGQQEDPETGLHYNLTRYYDPDTGTFISPDSIGLSGGLSLYAYPRDPTSWIDPWGEYVSPANCTAPKSQRRRLREEWDAMRPRMNREVAESMVEHFRQQGHGERAARALARAEIDRVFGTGAFNRLRNGRNPVGFVWHHIRPIARGGRNGRGNLGLIPSDFHTTGIRSPGARRVNLHNYPAGPGGRVPPRVRGAVRGADGRRQLTGIGSSF